MSKCGRIKRRKAFSLSHDIFCPCQLYVIYEFSILLGCGRLYNDENMEKEQVLEEPTGEDRFNLPFLSC